ncbi:MAG: hypothetical protein PHY45_10170 [Rhodocyclaceae bacterium]|nr:hypothetical protein [Rhodocyclaceae bacterium]
MSKLLKSALIVAMISSLAISPAWADRYGHYGHHGGGGDGGWGWWGPGLLLGTAAVLAASVPRPVYYYPPAPVYSAPVYVTPPVAPPVPVAEEAGWYYCPQAAGYYPYVRACPSGWLRVSPTPAG